MKVPSAPRRRCSVFFLLSGASVLCLLLAALFLKFELLAAATNPAAASVGDLLALYYPLMTYGFEALRAGHVPLWNPYQACGEPLLANLSIGFAYPLYLPFLFLPPAVAVNVDLVLHLAISALAMLLLCRHFQMGWWPSLVAGLIYSYQGSMMIKVNYPSFLAAAAWMPLLFLLVDRLLHRPQWRSCGWLAAVVGVSLLGGYFQFIYFTIWALGLFVIVRLAQLRQRRGAIRLLRPVALVALAGALGAAAALVRLLPGIAFIRQSWRPPGSLAMDLAAAMSVAPADFVKLLFSPVPPVEGRLFVGEYVNEVYTGTLPLALALLGLVLWRRRSVSLPIAAAGAAAVLYAFGPYGPLYPVLFRLPGGNWFRGPNRALIIFGFAVAFLCGAGLDALLRGAAGERRGRAGPVFFLGAALIVIVVGLGCIVGGPAGTKIGVLYAILGVSALAALLRFESHAARATAAALLAGVMLVDLFMAQRHTAMRPSQLDAYFSRYASFFDDIRQRQGLDRTYIWGSFRPQRPLYFFSDVAAAGLTHRVWLATSYNVSGSRIEKYLAALGPAMPFPIGYVVFQLSPSNIQLSELMGVRFLLLEDGLERKYVSGGISESWRLIRRQDGVALYEDPRAMPRAFLAGRVEVVAGDEALLHRLPQADLRTTALIERELETPLPASPSTDASTTEVTITDYTPNTVTVETDASQPGVLVLTDQYDPGWRATIDGAPTTIYRADYLFRGVRLPAGRHRVVFRYRPPSVVIGALGSLAGWLAIALVLARR